MNIVRNAMNGIVSEYVDFSKRPEECKHLITAVASMDGIRGNEICIHCGKIIERDEDEKCHS